MTESDRLTRTTAVPNWMVQLAVWAICVLGAGAVATLVSVVNWCFLIQHDQGELKSSVTAVEATAKAANEQIGGVRVTLQRIEQDVAIIKARMP